MILPRISIDRPVLATMMNLGLVVFGILGLANLPVRELPDIEPPIVSVTTVYRGANAAVIETEITERLEEAINNIEGIKTLTSVSREQVSLITVEFDLSRDIDLAAQDVRDRVARVRDRLPETINEPLIAKQDADARPIIWIGMNSDRFTPLELSSLAEKQIKNRLQTVGGVSSIFIGGEKRFAMRLWLNLQQMAAHQVTVLDVQKALLEQNVELPSGRVENLEREMTILTRGELKTVAEFNSLIIKTAGGKRVRLDEIGRATEGVDDERTIARINGKPCIFLGVVKQAKANTVEVAQGIKKELDRILPTLPAGITMVPAYDESIYVKQAIDDVVVSLGIAFGLVILVVYLFLGSLRSTLIPVVAIPVSIVATFAVLYLLDYSINILTMLALVLAIGVVIDDAIVVLENIHRHIENGLPPMQAARKAMEEISFAIIAITISLVAVFLPLAFQKSTTGRLFVEFAVAISGAVVISAFVALSLSPMMASRMLKAHQPSRDRRPGLFERGMGWFTRSYQRLLGWSLRHRIIICLLALASFGLTYVSFRALDNEFLPEEDKGRFLAFVIAPEGATAEYTDRMVREAESILSQTPEVESYGAIVAFAFSGPGLANQAIVFCRLKNDRKKSVQDIVNGPGGIRSRFIMEIEGALAIAQIPKAFDRSLNAPFQLVLQSHDINALNQQSRQFINTLNEKGYLVNLRSSFEMNKPELRVSIDRNRAGALGVSIDEISRTLQILFGGLDLSQISVDGKEYDVIAQLDRQSRLTPQSLDSVYVRNASGGLVQLSSLIQRDTGSSPNAIEHFNRRRSATITGTPMGVTLGNAVKLTETALKQQMPPGFSFEWSGESRDLRDTADEVVWFLALALLIVYMVLAAQFESLIHPITVILAVPLAFLGAFGSLWLLNFMGLQKWIPPIPAMNINLFSQIGLILLIGLVTKNSILLVEFANQQRKLGVSAREAMVQAGAIRLRPILMTAFSTIAGILPIAIGFGAGAESRRPMGVAVVGGMLTSTFLTLVIVPVVYTLFSDMAEFLKRKKAPLVSAPLDQGTPRPTTVAS